MQYAVEILPFETHMFECFDFEHSENDGGRPSKVLLSHPVTIATLKGSGPSPVPFTQRQRASMARKRPNRDGTDAMGALCRYGVL